MFENIMLCYLTTSLVMKIWAQDCQFPFHNKKICYLLCTVCVFIFLNLLLQRKPPGFVQSHRFSFVCFLWANKVSKCWTKKKDSHMSISAQPLTFCPGLSRTICLNTLNFYRYLIYIYWIHIFISGPKLNSAEHKTFPADKKKIIYLYSFFLAQFSLV